MMNILQPLPFYNRLSEQIHLKENSVGPSKILCYPDRLIPFQIVVPNSAQAITGVKLTGYKCEIEVDMTNATNAARIRLVTLGGRKYVVYNGDPFIFVRMNNSTSTIILPTDYFHLTITLDNSQSFYSDKFYPVKPAFCDRDISFQWEMWNDSSKQGYYFENGFKFLAYFDTFITSMTPNIFEDFSKDGYERDILNFRVVTQTYNFELEGVPNSMTAGLSAMLAFDNIYFTDIPNNNRYRVKNITFSPEPEEGGATDSILIGFTIFDNDLIKTLC
jgi:hypothetical protein